MLSEIAEIQALTKHLSNALENEDLVTVRNFENGKANSTHRKMTDASWKYPGLLQLSTHKGPNPNYTPANNKNFTKDDSITHAIEVVRSAIPH